MSSSAEGREKSAPGESEPSGSDDGHGAPARDPAVDGGKAPAGPGGEASPDGEAPIDLDSVRDRAS
jgi:hypothetical protein